MTTQTRTADRCAVCNEPVKGGFKVFSYARLGETELALEGTPDRDFNVCDLCNVTICYRCLVRPDSGYCNECYRMIMASQDLEEQEETHTNELPPTMQDPQIIYRDSDEDYPASAARRELVNRLMKHREVDISDFQARVETLCQKFGEVANDLESHMADIDATIMSVIHAPNIEQAHEDAAQILGKQTN